MAPGPYDLLQAPAATPKRLLVYLIIIFGEDRS